MARNFSDYFNLVVRGIGAVAAVKTLVALAVASGAAVTIVALWQQIPWYVAITAGCLIFASLMMAIAGLDHLFRVHGVKGKVSLREVRVRSISFNEQTKKLEVTVGLHIYNNSTRVLWMRIDRVLFRILACKMN